VGSSRTIPRPGFTENTPLLQSDFHPRRISAAVPSCAPGKASAALHFATSTAQVQHRPLSERSRAAHTRALANFLPLESE
jgi:hypothetical protein